MKRTLRVAAVVLATLPPLAAPARAQQPPVDDLFTVEKYLDLGALFVAVGLDTNLLVRGTNALAARFKPAAKAAPSGGTY